MSADKLGRELALAREELEAASLALAPKHKGGEWERYQSARRRCLSLERDLARAQGEECAVEIDDWPARWNVGAPLPHVVSSGWLTCVVYLLAKPDPNWDGSYTTVIDPSSGHFEDLAIVEFDNCLIHKFGGPNDEVLAGHQLHGKGLEYYSAHVVERSRWVAELQKINSVHSQYNPQAWTAYKHYILVFHDNTFECIAKGHSIDRCSCTFAKAIELCASRVVR